jgi:hypothetical protein
MSLRLKSRASCAYLNTSWERYRSGELAEPPFAYGVSILVKRVSDGTLPRDNEVVPVHVDANVLFLHPGQLKYGCHLVRGFRLVQVHSVCMKNVVRDLPK